MTQALPLTNSQVMILKTLARNSNGLTREDLAEKSGVVCDTDVLGPVLREQIMYHEDSLVAYGLVQAVKESHESPTVFVLTIEGEEASERYSGRKTGAKLKVDHKALDQAVLSIRNLKAYGLELFTDDDVKEVREMLPEEFQAVTLTDLKQQIVNRRKQGAYKTDRTKEPSWYVEYRRSPEFRLFSSKVIEFYGGCALDPNHNDLIEVYHRQLTDREGKSILGQERVKDGLALCNGCRRRAGRFICQLPEESPFTE